MQESGVEERSQEKGQEGKQRIRCLGVSSTQKKDSSKTHCEKSSGSMERRAKTEMSGWRRCGPLRKL